MPGSGSRRSRTSSALWLAAGLATVRVARASRATPSARSGSLADATAVASASGQAAGRRPSRSSVGAANLGPRPGLRQDDQLHTFGQHGDWRTRRVGDLPGRNPARGTAWLAPSRERHRTARLLAQPRLRWTGPGSRRRARGPRPLVQPAAPKPAERLAPAQAPVSRARESAVRARMARPRVRLGWIESSGAGLRAPEPSACRLPLRTIAYSIWAACSRPVSRAPAGPRSRPATDRADRRAHRLLSDRISSSVTIIGSGSPATIAR